MDLQLTNTYMASRPRLVRMIDDLRESGRIQHTVYLTAKRCAELGRSEIFPAHDEERAGSFEENRVATMLRETGKTDTGLAVFLGEQSAVAVAPPFPLHADAVRDGVDPSDLLDLLGEDFLIGIVLLRLGRYAVGVMRGDKLVATKTGSRYVKNRHRAGGSSQRRFERSRERLVRELYDKTCAVVRDVFTPHEDRLEYILLGGEKSTLQGFLRRCEYLEAHGQKVLDRRLAVERPGQAALDNIAFEVWKSRVLEFTPGQSPTET